MMKRSSVSRSCKGVWRAVSETETVRKALPGNCKHLDFWALSPCHLLLPTLLGPMQLSPKRCLPFTPKVALDGIKRNIFSSGQ